MKIADVFCHYMSGAPTQRENVSEEEKKHARCARLFQPIVVAELPSDPEIFQQYIRGFISIFITHAQVVQRRIVFVAVHVFDEKGIFPR